MTYRGHVENGAVVLDSPAVLPEGVQVSIEILTNTVLDEVHPEVRRISGILPAGTGARLDYLEAQALKHQ